MRTDGYKRLRLTDGRRVLEHVVIAERAFGGPLPVGAEVHHFDEDKSNNRPGNLVICPDAAYHKLLHQRQRAFDACGNYDWLKCRFCRAYDAPTNVVRLGKGSAHAHRSCYSAYQRATYAARRNYQSTTPENK